ncbi:hypothetical protein HMPREF9019_0052 [Hoylesella timonensis CRIS 5C-B1]|uniref:Lipoprotein n=2 Tax=Hoylesella timonensis TaxID=386414 RepID=D1W063_9BACT|nr:hypothetical protein HMPREF9019_0052 [Hoylesella timonensis CRIS 5C-B1]
MSYYIIIKLKKIKMKKLAIMFAAGLMLAACQSNGKKSTAGESQDAALDSATVVNTDTMAYAGEGPAADGTYKYSLKLYGDSITEFAYEQVAVTPKGTETMARTTGIAHLIQHNGKEYVRVQEHKEDSVTFLKLDDTTLRLVSKDFEEAGEGTNTDLKLVQ